MGKRDERKKRDKRKALKHRHVASAPTPEAGEGRFRVVRDLDQSGVLTDFLEPYLTMVKGEDQLRKLALMATVAWNATVAGNDRGEELIESVESTLPKDDRGDFREIIASMIVRKIQFFNDNVRLITDYDVIMTPQGPQFPALFASSN